MNSERKRRLPLRLLPFLLFFAVSGGALLHWHHRYHSPVTLEQLIDPKTRLFAFYKLWRVHEDSEFELFAPLHRWRNFQRYHLGVELLECPQVAEGDSLYLILLEQSELWPLNNPPSPFSSWENFRSGNEWSLWWMHLTDRSAPSPGPVSAPTLSRLPGVVIYLVNEDAQIVERPFDGDNVCDGIFFDVNRDGYIERVKSTLYGGFEEPGQPDEERRKDIRVEVLDVVRVKRHQEYLFSVMLNVDPVDDDQGTRWSWRCEDLDGDGLIEILIGPGEDPATMDPRVTFRWDEAAGTYRDAASPVEGDLPYRILEDGDNPWTELKPLFRTPEFEVLWGEKRMRHSSPLPDPSAEGR